MGKSKISSAKLAELFSKYNFVRVNDIYRASSPFARADEAKILCGDGFTVCIVGYEVLIQANRPERWNAALKYAKGVVMSHIRHNKDDEKAMFKLADEDAEMCDAYQSFDCDANDEDLGA